jgi:hypothetical protein
MPHIKGNVDNGQQTAWLSVKNLDTPYPAITISARPDSLRPDPSKLTQASRLIVPSRVPQASRIWTPWGCPESPDRPEQTSVQTLASVQSKNCLNYTVCYTSIKTTLQAARNMGFLNKLFSVNQRFIGQNLVHYLGRFSSVIARFITR